MKTYELVAVNVTAEGERVLRKALEKEVYCINNRALIGSYESKEECLLELDLIASKLASLQDYTEYSSLDDFKEENNLDDSDIEDIEDYIYWEGAGYYDIEGSPACPYYITDSESLEDEEFDLEIKEVESDSVDQLYVLLREAHKFSTNAKDPVFNNRYGNYRAAYKQSKERSREFYSKKNELIHDALVRAKELGIKTFFCDKECCFYFELDKGQVSFHTKGYFDDMDEITTVVDEYQWSGERNSGEIIDSYF